MNDPVEPDPEAAASRRSARHAGDGPRADPAVEADMRDADLANGEPAALEPDEPDEVAPPFRGR
jgi:hypothetical protein